MTAIETSQRPLEAEPGPRAPKHLLSIGDLSRAEALALLDSAADFFELSRQEVKKAPTLRGRTVLNLFFEASTRTRTSFELAGKRLSADVINIAASSSSTTKGETLRDTVATLNAMRPDVVVLRHAASGAAHTIARQSRAAVVNAGDGMHEHPTQALLDAFTIRRHFQDLRGIKVAICGDIRHSRVARSNVLLLQLLGAEVHFAAPRTMWPAVPEALGAKVSDRLEPALEGAHVVMMLRIQQERLGSALLPSAREYSRLWGLTLPRLRVAREGALVLHPGPMNRGVEINDDVAESPQAAILDQVEAGVAVRMAVLVRAAGQPGAAGS